MSEEIEIKLVGPLEALDKLLESHFLADYAEYKGRQQMRNCYYDTADLALNRLAMALRIRQRDDAYLQTLKTKGESVDGLHRRLEWEWPIERAELDLSRLPSSHWPETVAVTDLHPVFETNLERQLWHCTGKSEQGQHYCVEVALDLGQVLVSKPDMQLSEPIAELELELLEGDPAALVMLADALRRELPQLAPSDISKAQRGFALLNTRDQ
ncbi:MAG: inorganic triphosphatase [Pseudomonadales bacterium]